MTYVAVRVLSRKGGALLRENQSDPSFRVGAYVDREEFSSSCECSQNPRDPPRMAANCEPRHTGEAFCLLGVARNGSAAGWQLSLADRA